MPDATGLELIAHELQREIPGSVVDTSYRREQATLVTEPDKTKRVLRWLKEDPRQGYTFLSSLHGADYLPKKPRFGVHYELLSMERAERIHVKAPLHEPEDKDALPALHSCVDLFPTANFQEREVFDMFGIAFLGHPDLSRILMPQEYEGWPQRRDFPLGGEPVQFSFNERRYARYAREDGHIGQ